MAPLCNGRLQTDRDGTRRHPGIARVSVVVWHAETTIWCCQSGRTAPPPPLPPEGVVSASAVSSPQPVTVRASAMRRVAIRVMVPTFAAYWDNQRLDDDQTHSWQTRLGGDEYTVPSGCDPMLQGRTSATTMSPRSYTPDGRRPSRKTRRRRHVARRRGPRPPRPARFGGRMTAPHQDALAGLRRVRTHRVPAQRLQLPDQADEVSHSTL